MAFIYVFSFSGSSAGVYGFYGCIISVIILQWSHIWIWRRVFYVTQIAIFLIAEVVSSIVFYDLQTSYSGHLGGFIGGFLTGCAVININNDAVMQWKKNVKYASIIILSVVSGAGCANYLM
jgi:membrane associated rhomboid family serine protease